MLKTKDKIMLTMESAHDSDNEVKSKYDFIDNDMAIYIESLCEELDINPILVFGILIKENPQFDINATNKNANGTVDCGLFQLNDRYIWSDFKNRYWKFEDVELNPYNWKHNCYLAIHHIQYLQKNLKIQDEVIMAYNCGINAVINGKIPSDTKLYLTNVKTNMKLLEKIKEE
jgi:hypothetical protein